MQNTSKIINRGYRKCPSVGISGAFHRRQWVGTHDEWVYLVERSMEQGYRDRISNGIAHAPNDLMTYQIHEKDGYYYLYQINMRGNLDSVAYTHKVIAEGGINNARPC